MATITSLGFSIFSTYSGTGVSAARRDINQLNRDLSSNVVMLNNSSKAFFSLSTAAMTLGPGMLTVGSAVAAGAAAFTTMAVAGGGAAAVLGGAVLAAMKGTNESAKAIQASVKNVGTAFASWGNEVAPMLRGPVTTAVNAVSASFSRFTPLVAKLTPLANEVAQAFARWTATNLPGWVSWLGSTGSPILANFITIGKNLARTFGDMLKAFSPMAITMSNQLAVLSAKLRAWADGGGFTRFLESVRANGPQVRAFFDALGGAIRNVTAAFAGLGPLSLSVTTLLLRLISAMPPWMIQAIVVAILAWRTAMLVYAVAMTVATAAQIAFTIAASPFLILIAGAALTVLAYVAAIAALGVGLYFLVTRWNTVWNAIKATAITVWNFLTHGLGQLVLALMGPVGVLIFLGAHWQQIWTGMQLVATTVWNALKVGWQAFVNAMIVVWQTVSAALVASWNAVWNAMSVAARAIWSAMQVAWSAVINAMRTVMQAVMSAMAAIWSAGWNAMSAAARAIWSGLQAAWNAFRSAMQTAMTGMMNALKTAWSAAWNAIRTAAVAVWNALRTAFGAFSSAMKTAMTGLLNALKSAWSAAWNAIRTAATTVWNALRTAFGAFSSALKTAMTGLVNAVKTTWSNGWNAVKNTAQSIFNTIRGLVTTFANGVKKTITDLVSAVKSIWSKIVDAFKGPINTIIGIWNKVAGAIGLDKISLSGGGLADGGAARANGGPMLATGGHLSNSMAGTQRNDRIPALLSAGEFVMRASAVRKYGTNMMAAINAGHFASGGLVGAFAAGGDPDAPPNATPAQEAAAKVPYVYYKDGEQRIGEDNYNKLTAAQKAIVDAAGVHKMGKGVLDTIGGIVSGAAGFISGLLTDPLGFIKDHIGDYIGAGGVLLKGFDDIVGSILPINIGDVMKGLLGGLVDRVPDPLPPGTPKPAGSLIHASIKTLVDKAIDFFAEKQKAAVTAVSVAGAQSVSAWAPVILQALAMTGAPLSWLGGIEALMAAESGGNPNAINNWDINAINGVPSQGLMQVIPPTFLAYHQPGTSFNILDPLANIAAAINYIKARYGYVPGSPYARGTNRATRGWHLVGENGPEMRWFGGGEKVWNHRKSSKWMKEHGGGEGGGDSYYFENHWHGNPDKEAVQYAEGEMLDKMRQCLVAGSGRRAH